MYLKGTTRCTYLKIVAFLVSKPAAPLPMCPNIKLQANDAKLLEYSSFYRHLIGWLLYLIVVAQIDIMLATYKAHLICSKPETTTFDNNSNFASISQRNIWTRDFLKALRSFHILMLLVMSIRLLDFILVSWYSIWYIS